MIERDDYNEILRDFQTLKGCAYPVPQLNAVYNRLCLEGFDRARIKNALDYISRSSEIRYKDLYGAIHQAIAAMRKETIDNPPAPPRIYTLDREGQALGKLYMDFTGWLLARYPMPRYMEMLAWFHENYWLPFCDNSAHSLMSDKIKSAWKYLAQLEAAA